METNQRQSVSKRVARGKRLGRRYCERHRLEYKPLHSPAGRPKVKEHSYEFDLPELCDNCTDRICNGCTYYHTGMARLPELGPCVEELQ